MFDYSSIAAWTGETCRRVNSDIAMRSMRGHIAMHEEEEYNISQHRHQSLCCYCPSSTCRFAALLLWCCLFIVVEKKKEKKERLCVQVRGFIVVHQCTTSKDGVPDGQMICFLNRVHLVKRTVFIFFFWYENAIRFWWDCRHRSLRAQNPFSSSHCLRLKQSFFFLVVFCVFRSWAFAPLSL